MIFLEDREGAPDTVPEYLKSVGLEDHAQGAEVMVVTAKESFTGQPGKLIAWKAIGDNQHRIDQEKQIYIHNKRNNYHVVIWKDAPPKEAELRREKTQGGKFIRFGEDGDQSSWKIAAHGQIDQRIHFEDDESVRFTPIRKYAWFVDECQKILEETMTIEGDSVSYKYSMADAAALVLKSLRINYRITPEVVNHLNLLTIKNISDAYQAILGLNFKAEDE
jgi:hypothetical protein